MTGPVSEFRAQPYHHGNLHQALLLAAVDLVRTGAPAALTLRGASRRAGASANAAYRHFAGLPEMQHAVAEVGKTELAQSMLDELVALSQTDTGHGPDDLSAQAAEQFKAVGRGYVHYPLAQPGLFAAITFAPATSEQHFLNKVAMTGSSTLATPAHLLGRALHALAGVVLIPLGKIPAAATTAWAGVHGLSTLLQGPLADRDLTERARTIESTLKESPSTGCYQHRKLTTTGCSVSLTRRDCASRRSRSEPSLEQGQL